MQGKNLFVKRFTLQQLSVHWTGCTPIASVVFLFYSVQTKCINVPLTENYPQINISALYNSIPCLQRLIRMLPVHERSPPAVGGLSQTFEKPNKVDFMLAISSSEWFKAFHAPFHVISVQFQAKLWGDPLPVLPLCAHRVITIFPVWS